MKIKKNQAIYLSENIKSYNCENCIFFLSKKNRCFLHKSNEEIKPNGSCNFFLAGEKLLAYPSSITSKNDSGYAEHEVEVCCGTCLNFLEGQSDCKLVDRYSLGKDCDFISSIGCCNFWQNKNNLIELNIEPEKPKTNQKTSEVKIVQKTIDIASKNLTSEKPRINLADLTKKKG